jgi:predicted TIM-barrel fold metal-dependent hydrolase
MKYFDSHTHLEKGKASYDLPGVSRWNVIFNTVESYQQNKHRLGEQDTVSLIFDYRRHYDFVKNEISSGRVQALKIHTREQHIDEQEYALLERRLAALKTTCPVIYDAFYYGHALAHQPSLAHIIRLARHFPDRPIVVAHSGGYEVLKYFVHLRTLSNIYYDLSFSLQYLQDSSCFPDFVKLIAYTDKSRILFGSDFPWASPRMQFRILKRIFRRLRLSKLAQQQILFDNANRLFSRPNKV